MTPFFLGSLPSPLPLPPPGHVSLGLIVSTRVVISAERANFFFFFLISLGFLLLMQANKWRG